MAGPAPTTVSLRNGASDEGTKFISIISLAVAVCDELLWRWLRVKWQYLLPSDRAAVPPLAK